MHSTFFSILSLARFTRAVSVALLLASGHPAMALVLPDMAQYSADCGIQVQREAETLRVAWPAGGGGRAAVTFDLREGQPLLAAVALAAQDAAPATVLRALDPLLALTVGTRVAPPGRPPEMSIWNTFFDSPAKRPHQTHLATLTKKHASVASVGRRATVRIGALEAGSFSGELAFTFFADAPLVQIEAVLSTAEDGRAYFYELGLVGDGAGWKSFAWTDTEGQRRHAPADESAPAEALAVRHRLLAVEGAHGSVAVFPPPHQFFFPVDIATNNKFLWRGRGHRGAAKFGLGIRQDAEGGGRFVPWFNAPPGTQQRMGMFLLVSAGGAEAALEAALRYTRGDRFAELPGMTTFTSHYHMAVAMTALEQQRRGIAPLPVPEFVQVFKEMNVQAVHLGEFHGDGHPQDPGPLRLPEMQMMFRECARLSDDRLLLIPGEEANQFLGLRRPGRHPGHWMLLFPRPVYWTMARLDDQPAVEQHPDFGTVHHVGSREEMAALIRREQGLAWTAHARIKASSWTPDIFKDEDFFIDDLWLGAAWKAMPADLSRERLGERCLDLLDDMCNWGRRKYLPGEVDVFKLDRTSELYGHMNINYLRLARMPRYADGWQPVLDALRTGAFFTTTGEVLIEDFTVGGKHSGETLAAADAAEVRVKLSWTFPMKFAEVISGDGAKVYRERLELTDTGSFGSRTLTLHPALRGRRWVRVEAWDVAANGAYTQPVWLEH